MKTLGYYNGRFDELENMTVPMNDRACSFGDGVYDSAYARNHIIYSLSEHIDRIFSGASLLGITPPCTKEEMRDTLNEMVNKVDASETFVYWQLTRGTMPRNHAYPEGMKANFWIIIREMSIRDTYRKIRLISREDTRFFHCNIKSLNLIPAVMAASAAENAGADECVFHRNGRVTECAHSNVHMLKDGVFITPPADELMLAGIQRGHLMQKCTALGIPVEVRPFTLEELFMADEVIVSSAGSLCLSACELDGRAVGGKAPGILKTLQDSLLSDFIEATTPKS